MTLDVRRSPPFYRKLLLENKILLFFTSFLISLGLIALALQYWSTTREAEILVRDRLEAALAPCLGEIGDAVTRGDPAHLAGLLETAADRDVVIDYLSATDSRGDLLSPVTPAPAVPAREEPHRPESVGMRAVWNRLFPPTIRIRLPLTSRGARVGTLEAGFARRHVSGPARRSVATVTVLMFLPILVVLLIARISVRRVVVPLKKLTRVAEEISTGNLSPRMDFGVRVNCWEIMDCQRPDCKAYMNLSDQCWYMDGTPCEGYESKFPQKLQGCRTCKVYRLQRGDEIVQLADAFRHMASVLQRSREALTKSADYQNRLIQNSIDGIVAADENDTVTIFNQVAEDLIGVSQEEVIGVRDWRAFFKDGLEHEMDQPLSWGRVRRTRGFAPKESAILRPDGKLVDVLLSGISLFERGRHLGKVFFFQDMREIKNLREELIQSERLAATGQAAAGISHSIKNILDGFMGGAYVFKQGRKRGDERKMDTGWDMIERNMEIISSLVRDLLNFSKDRKPDFTATDPGALIEDTLMNLGVNHKGRIRFRTEIEPPVREVMLDAHAFHQCLANLIRNAVEAIPPDRGGTVEVGHRIEGDTAVFTVRDDGDGMTDDIVEKVKGGMYSTKGSKGTGLGLLVIQKIVREHGGVLKIESEPGKGSTFRIEIPAGGSVAVA